MFNFHNRSQNNSIDGYFDLLQFIKELPQNGGKG